jgi:hypothetical protein
LFRQIPLRLYAATASVQSADDSAKQTIFSSALASVKKRPVGRDAAATLIHD